MPWAGDIRPLEMTVAQRTSTMKAGIRQRIILSAHIEQGHSLSVYLETSSGTLWELRNPKGELPHLKREYQEYPASNEANTPDRGNERETRHAIYGDKKQTA